MGPSAARVRFHRSLGRLEKRQALGEMRRQFGASFTLRDFASVAGAPAHARVTVDYSAEQGPIGIAPRAFTVTVRAPEIESMQRTFYTDARGRKMIYNDVFKTTETGTGFGLRAFARQVENASALGFRAIETDAMRGEKWNGYATWAKFGYNAPLTSGIRAELPRGLGHARSLHELRKTEAGRAWWEKHGESTNMRFNLAPGSRSMRELAAYRARKAELAATSPASRPPE
jgi:hypothetical protein